MGEEAAKSFLTNEFLNQLQLWQSIIEYRCNSLIFDLSILTFIAGKPKLVLILRIR